jgi:hypothetical protein
MMNKFMIVNVSFICKNKERIQIPIDAVMQNSYFRQR